MLLGTWSKLDSPAESYLPSLKESTHYWLTSAVSLGMVVHASNPSTREAKKNPVIFISIKTFAIHTSIDSQFIMWSSIDPPTYSSASGPRHTGTAVLIFFETRLLCIAKAVLRLRDLPASAFPVLGWRVRTPPPSWDSNFPKHGVGCLSHRWFWELRVSLLWEPAIDSPWEHRGSPLPTLVSGLFIDTGTLWSKTSVRLMIFVS